MNGSAEGNKCYLIDGGQMFLETGVRKERKWDEQRIKKESNVISDTYREKVQKSILDRNTLITNQPSRLG